MSENTKHDELLKVLGLHDVVTKGAPLEKMTREQKIDELLIIITDPENNLDAIWILRCIILDPSCLDDKLKFAREIINKVKVE